MSNAPSSQDDRLKKYYVRCGPTRWVGLAATPDIAALRFIHAVLRQSNGALMKNQPVSPELNLVNAARCKSEIAKLPATTTISERGYDHDECGVFATQVVARRWYNQISALQQMLRR